MFDAAEAVVHRVEDFLGLRRAIPASAYMRTHNKNTFAEKARASAALNGTLDAFFAPHNAALYRRATARDPPRGPEICLAPNGASIQSFFGRGGSSQLLQQFLHRPHLMNPTLRSPAAPAHAAPHPCQPRPCPSPFAPSQRRRLTASGVLTQCPSPLRGGLQGSHSTSHRPARSATGGSFLSRTRPVNRWLASRGTPFRPWPNGTHA
mmetsp:Transcript_43154/g.143685  ORF Transcript_43154/g.143685 Transcript_43154/m.143685 type:complete len:207 (-) Transcript_43154:3144-3764(-)